jgi:S-(hydroxymethyl)glutathione dehydrogenase/alcohol dehydrogenase
VRVRLLAAGICHTDHASLRWPGPRVLGHEGAGEVESVGEGVEQLCPGQPVLLNWAIPCGRCPQCHRGRGQAVERAFRLGTWSEYTLVRAEALTLLPPRLSPRCACILGCGVMTGVGAVLNVAAVQAGDTVAIVGCGGVGLSVVQGARLAGASRIIAVDRREDALARARAFGATHTVLSPKDDPGQDILVAEVRALTQGRGVDHAFEATGSAALAGLPLKLARNGGQAVQLSGAHGAVTLELPDFWWDKRYIVPLYGGCQPERDFPRLFAWAESGALDLAGMVSHTYTLEQLPQALEDMLAGRSAKGVVLFSALRAP